MLAFLLKENKSIIIELPSDKKAMIANYSVQSKYSEGIAPIHVENNASCTVDTGGKLTKAHQLINVKYIRLSDSDVNSLISEGSFELTTAESYFEPNAAGEYKEHDVCMVSIKEIVASFGESKCCLTKSVLYFSDTRVESLFSSGDGNFKYERLVVSMDSIFAFESDVSEFIINTIDLIPEDSPYFIKPELRGMSDLEQLAEIAAKYCGYGAETNVKTSDLAR